MENWQDVDKIDWSNMWRLELYVRGRNANVNLKLKNMRFTFASQVREVEAGEQLADRYSCPAPQNPLEHYDVVLRQELGVWRVLTQSSNSSWSVFKDAIEHGKSLLNQSRDGLQSILVDGHAVLTQSTTA